MGQKLLQLRNKTRMRRQTADYPPEEDEESEVVVDGDVAGQFIKRRGRMSGQTYTPPPMLVEAGNKVRLVVFPIREQIRVPLNAKFPAIPLIPKVIKLPSTSAPVSTRTKHLSHPIDI